MHQATPPLRERPGLAVHASRVARRFFALRAKGLAAAAVAGVFMAAVGAFGSGEAPALVRFPYWVALMLSGGLIGGIIAEVFLDQGWLDGRFWLLGAAMTAAMTLPLTVVAWVLTTLTFDDPWRVERLAVFLPAVAIVSAVMTALNFLIAREPVATHAPAASAVPSPVRFLERLPPKLRGAELYAVEAEDHYLRLHTSRGSDLILLRLSDAIAELEGIEGAQTHRSWWVARSAVAQAERGHGRATLTLKDGAAAPVSRTYAKALRDAGWFS